MQLLFFMHRGECTVLAFYWKGKEDNYQDNFGFFYLQGPFIRLSMSGTGAKSVSLFA